MTDDEVPRLPRGKGLRLRTADLLRIGMFATLLVCILALGQPCADGVARFVESFAPPPDAGPAELKLERLTEEQIRERFPASEGRDPAAGSETRPESETASGAHTESAPR